MLVLRILSGLAFAILTVGVGVFVFLYALSKSLEWLDKHYGTTIRRLITKYFPKSSDNSGEKGCESESPINSHYIAQHTPILFKWIVDYALNIHIRHPSDSRDHKRNKATNEGFVQTRHFLNWRVCSPHRFILNRFRRSVNHSGTEPIH
jgi:hypothetical protein